MPAKVRLQVLGMWNGPSGIANPPAQWSLGLMGYPALKPLACSDLDGQPGEAGSPTARRFDPAQTSDVALHTDAAERVGRVEVARPGLPTRPGQPARPDGWGAADLVALWPDLSSCSLLGLVREPGSVKRTLQVTSPCPTRSSCADDVGDSPPAEGAPSRGAWPR